MTEKETVPTHQFLLRFLSLAFSTFRWKNRKELSFTHKTKIRSKNFFLPTCASWIVSASFLLSFSINTNGQIHGVATPQFRGTSTPSSSGYRPPTQNNPHGRTAQQYRPSTPQENQEANERRIRESMKTQTGYYTPNANNNFNQYSPEQRTQAEMIQTLQEVEYNAYVVENNHYYTSSKHLNDLPNYLKAQKTLQQMLQGKIPLSLKDAYYIAEAAYGNLHLSYQEYTQTINANTRFIKQWLKENQYNLNDPEALHLGIQKFLSDTLSVKGVQMDNAFSQNKQSHRPFSYDYIDYDSRDDRRNYFVTKTLATGTGQCHTLPITYLILAEALSVDVSLSYNPTHSFIRYKNNKGTTVNYETTIDRFLPDQFYLETLPVMAKAKKNSIYMNNLNKQQVVATVMIDLAVSFVREHWLADKQFITDCMNIASAYFPNAGYINTANDYLNKRLYADAFNRAVKENNITDLQELDKYPDALKAYQEYKAYMDKRSSLGIQDFPETEYLRMMHYYDKKGKLQKEQNPNAKAKKDLFVTY